MIDWNKFLGRCGIALLFVSLCAIGFEGHVCPATRFFELIEIIGNDMIDEYTYRINCI